MTSKHSGGCHCGAIRFEVALDLDAGASRCNCSVCTKIAQTGAIAKPDAFAVLTDETTFGRYAWGGKTATRFFCPTCGVHRYGRGHLEQLGGDYISVNVNCLDDVDPDRLKVVYFDGRHDNWRSGPRDRPWPIDVLEAKH